MTAKKGTLKELDAWEQNIRDNAEYYNAVLFIPATSSRQTSKFKTLDGAKEYSIHEISAQPNVRTAMIYAVNKTERSALVGSIGRNLVWKEVIPARYK